MAISGSLVGYYNDNGYPAIDGQYKPRIRIILVASLWMSVFSRESSAASVKSEKTWGRGKEADKSPDMFTPTHFSLPPHRVLAQTGSYRLRNPRPLGRPDYRIRKLTLPS